MLNTAYLAWTDRLLSDRCTEFSTGAALITGIKSSKLSPSSMPVKFRWLKKLLLLIYVAIWLTICFYDFWSLWLQLKLRFRLVRVRLQSLIRTNSSLNCFPLRYTRLKFSCRRKTLSVSMYDFSLEKVAGSVIGKFDSVKVLTRFRGSNSIPWRSRSLSVNLILLSSSAFRLTLKKF